LFTDILLTAAAVTPHSRPGDYDKQCLEADMLVLVAYLKVVVLELVWRSCRKPRETKNVEPVSGPNFELVKVKVKHTNYRSCRPRGV
jgi:hypothetical protein